MKQISLAIAMIVTLIALGCGGGSPNSSTPAPQGSNLQVSSSSLTFTATAGAANPATQTFTITSTGAPLNWSATGTTGFGNWLSFSPSSGTTPTTVTVSADITGLGASSFKGSLTVTPSGNSAQATVNVALQLASPQPPYFTGANPFLLPIQGPSAISMPDGRTIPNGSNQLLVFLSPNPSPNNMQAVATAISSAGATVVGEIPSLSMLQVQVSDTSKIADLMVALQNTQGVSDAGPNLFGQRRQTTSCGNTTPMGTGWMQVDDLATSSTADDVLVAVLDADASHRQFVTDIASDAAGSVFSQNISQVDTGTENETDMLPAASTFVANHPGKKIIFIVPAGPDATDNLGEDEAEEMKWMGTFSAAAKAMGKNVLFVQSAANEGLAYDPVQFSCNMLIVGGFSQETATQATLDPESGFGVPVSGYAPDCEIAPTAQPNNPDSGNSFSAPQWAGQLAVAWASNTSLTACQLAAQVNNLPGGPAAGFARRLDGKALLALAKNPQPVSQPLSNPLLPLPCPGISVAPTSLTLSTGQSAQLQSTLNTSTVSGPFQYQSTNTSVATVNSSTGLVTGFATGSAVVNVFVTGLPCPAQTAVQVGGDTFTGTFNITVSETSANTPGWTPDPITILSTVSSAPLTVVTSGSLLNAGPFTGMISAGPGTVTVSVPAETCEVCNPPVTVPGSTTNTAFPASTAPLGGGGVSDGKAITIPVDGYPPITGTISVLASTVQLDLTWDFQLSDGVGGVIQVQLNASLTKH